MLSWMTVSRSPLHHDCWLCCRWWRVLWCLQGSVWPHHFWPPWWIQAQWQAQDWLELWEPEGLQQIKLFHECQSLTVYRKVNCRLTVGLSSDNEPFVRVVMTLTPTTFCPVVCVLVVASKGSPCPPTTAVASAEALRSCLLRVSSPHNKNFTNVLFMYSSQLYWSSSTDQSGWRVQGEVLPSEVHDWCWTGTADCWSFSLWQARLPPLDLCRYGPGLARRKRNLVSARDGLKKPTATLGVCVGGFLLLQIFNICCHSNT